MHRSVPTKMTANARSLRKNQTDAERVLWYALRRRMLGVKFRRQVPQGPYILDFACLKRRLVIEADGGQHAENEADRQRDGWLRSQGFRVLRFSNADILRNLDGVLLVIEAALQQSSGPDPLPASPCQVEEI